jgi:hypothetical protein
LLEELNSETTTAVESLVAMELSGTLFAVSRREFSRASNQHLEGLRMLLATSFTAAAGSTGTSPQGSPVIETHHGSSGDGSSSSSGPGAGTTRVLPAVAMSGQMHAGLYDTALASQGIVLPPIPATATGTPELLSMMAAALTYYSLACRRLSDTVSMSIMHHLVTAFTTRFRWVLVGGAAHAHGTGRQVPAAFGACHWARAVCCFYQATACMLNPAGLRFAVVVVAPAAVQVPAVDRAAQPVV